MPTATGDLAYTPFNHQHPFPPDLRMQRDTLNDRDVISAPIRWEGMLVYVLENQTTYQLRGGLTNEYWAVFVGGGGGDVSNSVLYTIQSLTPAQQLQARLNIGAGELMDGLISLGPVTSLVNDVTIDSVLARINGTNVGSDTPTTINVPVPTAGNTRRDLIVIDGSGLIYLVQGTEVLESQTAITPNVPADTVVLVETFSNDTGLQDVYDFAYSAFVRFDINSQGLSPLQRLNARTNIQAVSKDTDDIRTGFLRQEGLLTVIGDYRQEVENGTSSTNAWSFINPYGGGASFRRSGGLTVVSDGDSMTDYLIFRGFDNNGAEVFRVRQGGVTKGGDAINLDDFVTLGQVQGLIDTSEQTGVTEFSGDDFFTGYRIDGATRVPQIFDKTDKDVIVTDTGNIILNPATQVANFIFTGNETSGVTELRGIESALDGREIHLTNRTGSDFLIIDNYIGGPLNSAFNFGGTNYTFANGSTISFIGNGTYWTPSVVNEVAFSDNLDSVNAIISTGPDNLQLISHVYDKETGEQVQFKEIAGTHTPDGVVIISIGSKYFKNTAKEYYIETFGKIGQGSDSTILQSALNGISKTEAKKLIINGFDVILTTAVTSSTSGLTIEFRNGGQISQPTPATNTTWSAQTLRLQLTGDNITLINFQTDGKFNNAGLSTIPSPVGKFVEITGDNLTLLGKTILKNSGGYNLDLRGDNVYAEYIEDENNAYTGYRLAPGKNIEKHEIGTFKATRNILEGARDTGMIVNGEFDIQLIEIGTYIGLNANLFTEAVVNDTQFLPYYKKISIGHYINIFDRPNTVTSSIMGKMENVLSISIDKFDNFYRHATNTIQGPQFAQVVDMYIGEINTNVGSWFPAENMKIGNLKYTDEGKTYGNTIFKAVDSTRNVDIIHVKTVISGTAELIAMMELNATSKFRILGDNTYTGTELGLVVAPANNIRNQVQVNNFALTGSAPLAFSQSISFQRKYQIIYSPTYLTRDVIKGEIFIFETTDHVIWECIKSGTSTWSGNTFTGTAIFKKTISQTNYIGTPLTNLSLYLTSNDTGITALVDSVQSVWVTDKWVSVSNLTPINRSGLDVTLTASYANYFNSFTSGAGTATVPANVFVAGQEVHGISVNGAKTFVAGSGLLLRMAAGEDGVLPPNGRYLLTFRTTTEAHLTIFKPAPTILSASATLDFPVISSDANTTLTTTVTGAVLGNNVTVAGPADIYNAGGRIDAWVSNTDTVTVRVKNDGGTSIDPTSGTFNIKVFK